MNNTAEMQRIQSEEHKRFQKSLENMKKPQTEEEYEEENILDSIRSYVISGSMTVINKN